MGKKISSIFKGIASKIKGVDPFYALIKREQIDLYQYFFKKIIQSVNVDNYTNFVIKGKGSYDKDQLLKDEDIIEKIISNEVTVEGLHGGLLQVMVHQYFWADVYQREMSQDVWVHTVLSNKDKVAFFPDAEKVAYVLNNYW